ncbi:polyketide synthase [Myxococcus stipitatus DSM 14675]|uniref:Polyketide synthase n=1 Tax=Myxococcus stipitatus (strain DSM 14675 / JCM 12634 / Mx s8) TaxID=1278073 RepID=L7UED9_MYXSD|nr:type I polyketide synthase [Myxococcus stipitatus]AGC47286.1 polyketide synthase [Myxococcus stipitatus DSM 14675]
MSAPGEYGDLMKRALLKLQEAQSQLDAHARERHEGLAIVGMGCRFPGGASTPGRYWRLLLDGTDAISEVPPERWDVDALYHPDPDQPGKVSCRFGSFLEDIDQFEPRFFGISPREAARMDPQHRLLLEVTWEALESSGRNPASLHGTRTGVFVGMMGQDYTQLATQSPELIDAHTGAGNSASVASGRLSYTFGFQGPSLTVDTACSSSLVALHLALRSLRQREVDFAVVGGVNLVLSPVATLMESRAHMLSADGRCKTFDAAANGIGRGEGCGVLVLRRLSDALADEDPIVAVIRGSAVNQDGRTSGLTVPNGLAQRQVIQDALRDARVEASRVGYVEAHGTGTALGDPIELEALGAVYGDRTAREQPLRVGSVKTNLGHLEGAAGIAGVLKAALCLANEEIPPHLHLRTPTPHVDWSRLFVEVPTERRGWKAEAPRFAAVSSFGFSGTNAHVILESAPRLARAPARSTARPLDLLTLSARSAGSLHRLAESFADALSGPCKDSLADVCHTARVSRGSMEERAAFVASTSEEMVAALRAFAHGETGTRGRREAESPRVAWLFTGQGAQYAGMGRELFETEPGFRRDLLRFEELLGPHLDRPLTEVLFRDDSGALNETRYTQPATVALELAVAGLLRSWGVQPDAVLGHSVGEYAAAIFAGALTPEVGLPLVAERARLMQALPERGGMLALFTDEARALRALAGHDRVTLAALNGPRNTVVSGAESSLDAIARELAAEGIGSQRLKVSHAFHSPLMQPMLEAFARVAGAVRLQAPEVPLISNLDGAEAGAALLRPDYWVRHVREPVRFEQGLRTLLQRGVSVFVEVGPKAVLSNLARDGVAPEGSVWLETLHPRRSACAGLLRTLAELFVRGARVDGARLAGDAGVRRISLPTYPFERQRHWLDVPAPWARPTRPSTHPLLGARWESPALREGTTVFSRELDARSLPLLSDHRVFGKGVVPAAAFVEMVASAVSQVVGAESMSLEAVTLHQPLVLPEQRTRVVQTLLEEQGAAGFTCTVMSQEEARGARASWTTHLTCRVSSQGTLPSPPRLELDAWRRSCPSPVDIGDFSEAIRQRGLDYGPSLSVLSSLHRGPHAALSSSEVAEGGVSYRAHPALLDACLRTAAAVTPLSPEDEGLLLPVAIQRLDLHRRLPERLWTYATQRPEAEAAGHPITDMTLCAEDGTVVASLTGLSVRGADRDVLLRGLEVDWREWLYRVTWSPCASPEAERVSDPHWVLFTDEAGFGEEVAALLEQRGARVTRVRQGSEFLQGPTGFQVDPARPAHFEQLFSTWDGASPQGLLYLWGLDAGDSLESAQRSGCVGALHLVRALAQRSWAPAPRLVIATRGTQALPADVQGPRIAQAPLWGFGQAVSTELPELRCLRVDLPGEPVPTDAEALLRACALPEQECQVAVRTGALHTARLEHARPRAMSRKLEVSPAASYLIAGGLGGLGLRLAGWLADRGAKHLLLLGRRGPSPEAQRRIEALEARGVHVRVAQADLASRDAVAAALSEARGAPPLRGLFHVAGVLHDGTLVHQTAEQLHEVLAPKVQGAWNLHELSAGLPLDFFICFSSAASLLGTPGQSNYVAANAFLDALAHLRHAQGLPALTLNWGSWAETGMAARLGSAAEGTSSAMGFETIPVERGLEVLERLMGGAGASLGVFPVDWRRLGEKWPGLSRQAFFQGLLGTTPHAPRAPVFRAQLEAAAPTRRLELLRQHVSSQVSRTLGLAESERLSGHERLFDLGFDSLLAVELKNRLASSLGRNLRSTLVFDFPSVAGLVSHLAGELGLGGEAPKRVEGPARDDSLAAEIQTLSEQELTSLIDQELMSALTR